MNLGAPELLVIGLLGLSALAVIAVVAIFVAKRLTRR